jgi:hypothetical protein
MEHESVVQGLASSQFFGSWRQVPVAVSQESTVHGFKSLQDGQSAAAADPMVMRAEARIVATSVNQGQDLRRDCRGAVMCHPPLRTPGRKD